MTITDRSIWTEDDRPKSWDEYFGHEEEVSNIRAKLEAGTLDVIILEGPAGTGKTTIARLIAADIQGSYQEGLDNMLDLNGSDENGIDVMRGKVKNHCKNSSITGKKKVVFLDEAEYLTGPAQGALRRIIEDHKKQAIFIFATNNVAKIISPLISRGHKNVFHFGPLDEESAHNLVRYFNNKYTINITKKAVNDILYQAKGDARAIVAMLQDYKDGVGINTEHLAGVYKFVDMLAEYEITDPVEPLQFITEDDLSAIMRYIMSKDIPMEGKATLVKVLAEADRDLQNSHNKDLQLVRMIMKLSEVWP